MAVHKPIATGTAELNALEGVVQVECGLGAAQEKIPFRMKHAADLGQYLFLAVDIKIDQHITQEDNVNGRKSRPGIEQVEAAELDNKANVVVELSIIVHL